MSRGSVSTFSGNLGRFVKTRTEVPSEPNSINRSTAAHHLARELHQDRPGFFESYGAVAFRATVAWIFPKHSGF
jgi:hypothetical protein